MSEGTIFDIKEFTVHDGPGIRITVFFKGCPLRCVWCHNPEGLSPDPELMVAKASCMGCGKCRVACGHPECRGLGRCTKICPHGLIRVAGEIVEAEKLADRLKDYRDILTANNGGITLSGGEPLCQPDFLIDLLKELKPLHTAVETSGYGKPDVFRQVIALADLILFDIKHTDPDMHKKLTGLDNGLILQNLKELIGSGRAFIARIPVIPGVNDTGENMENTAQLLRDAPGLAGVEFLPYNPFAGAKYAAVDRKYAPFFDEERKPEIHTHAFDRYSIRYSIL